MADVVAVVQSTHVGITLYRLLGMELLVVVVVVVMVVVVMVVVVVVVVMVVVVIRAQLYNSKNITTEVKPRKGQVTSAVRSKVKQNTYIHMSGCRREFVECDLSVTSKFRSDL